MLPEDTKEGVWGYCMSVTTFCGCIKPHTVVSIESMNSYIIYPQSHLILTAHRDSKEATFRAKRLNFERYKGSFWADWESLTSDFQWITSLIHLWSCSALLTALIIDHLPRMLSTTYLCCQISPHLMYGTDVPHYFWKHVIHMSIWTLATFISFDHLISAFLFHNLTWLIKGNVKLFFDNCFWENNALPKH